MFVCIKNRNDVYHFRLEYMEVNPLGAEVLNFEFYVNLKAIGSIEFHDNYEHPYAIGFTNTKDCRQSIVFTTGASVEVIAFEESAGGEYQRVKREFEEYLTEIRPIANL